MNRLVILGAGGYGRTVADMAHQFPRLSKPLLLDASAIPNMEEARRQERNCTLNTVKRLVLLCLSTDSLI